MTSCGQQSLNALAVLLLLISAGRASVGARREGGAAGGESLPGSVPAWPGFWVLPGGAPSPLPHWYPLVRSCCSVLCSDNLLCAVPHTPALELS